MNITVYQYLWEYKSDLLQKVRSFAPFLVPTENSGALHTVIFIFISLIILFSLQMFLFFPFPFFFFVDLC